MDIERLKELKLAVGVVFQHWLDTAANQKGFDNTDSKKFFERDAEHIQEILDEAIARQSLTDDEAVKAALTWFDDIENHEIVHRIKESPSYTSTMPDNIIQTIITALQQMRTDPCVIDEVIKRNVEAIRRHLS